MILIIDNYDSFTYNLVQLIGKLNYKSVVYRNDELSILQINQLKPEKIIISPGPGHPIESGICLDLIYNHARNIPILGICLGHQSIGLTAGHKVIRAPKLMHGKISLIYHNGAGIFKNIPNPFPAMRYHSLIIEDQSVAFNLQLNAWTQEGIMMGCELIKYPNVQGIQFHPESLWTQEGEQIVKNFLNL
uniref:Anthranilate synthase component 2 n=1 Tax=Corynoplastis japonica TaxID=700918 RepID=A0A1X9PW01_9RHOD|nr:anthranilate synthase component II [Corynoplastis japonica]